MEARTERLARGREIFAGYRRSGSISGANGGATPRTIPHHASASTPPTVGSSFDVEPTEGTAAFFLLRAVRSVGANLDDGAEATASAEAEAATATRRGFLDVLDICAALAEEFVDAARRLEAGVGDGAAANSDGAAGLSVRRLAAELEPLCREVLPRARAVLALEERARGRADAAAADAASAREALTRAESKLGLFRAEVASLKGSRGGEGANGVLGPAPQGSGEFIRLAEAEAAAEAADSRAASALAELDATIERMSAEHARALAERERERAELRAALGGIVTQLAAEKEAAERRARLAEEALTEAVAGAQTPASGAEQRHATPCGARGGFGGASGAAQTATSVLSMKRWASFLGEEEAAQEEAILLARLDGAAAPASASAPGARRCIAGSAPIGSCSGARAPEDASSPDRLLPRRCSSPAFTVAGSASLNGGGGSREGGAAPIAVWGARGAESRALSTPGGSSALGLTGRVNPNPGSNSRSPSPASEWPSLQLFTPSPLNSPRADAPRQEPASHQREEEDSSQPEPSQQPSRQKVAPTAAAATPPPQRTPSQLAYRADADLPAEASAASETPSEGAAPPTQPVLGFPAKYELARRFAEAMLMPGEASPLSVDVSDSDRLLLLALARQAEHGPWKKGSPAPKLWHSVERAKWRAWRELGAMSKAEAMYVT